MTQKHIFITDTDFANTDSSFLYVLWFQPSLWAMILTDMELIVFLDGRYFAKTQYIDIKNIQAKVWNPNLELRFVLVQDLTESLIWEISNEDELCFQDNIAIKYVEDIKKKFPNNQITTSWSYFQEKREIKSPAEKKAIISAIEIIDKVFLFIESMVDSWEIIWKTEIQVRQRVIQKIFEFWWDGESFETIIAFWKNSAVPHHVSWNTRITDGVLLIDMWAKYAGYCSDFTRTIWVWRKNQQFETFQKVYQIVKNSHESSFTWYTHWMSGSDLDTMSRDIIQNSEFKDLFIHNLWHSLGIDIHENPRLKQGDTTVLRDGMVFTIEPWIYIDNEFGVRLEDIVFLEDGRLRKYTNIPL